MNQVDIKGHLVIVGYRYDTYTVKSFSLKSMLDLYDLHKELFTNFDKIPDHLDHIVLSGEITSSLLEILNGKVNDKLSETNILFNKERDVMIQAEWQQLIISALIANNLTKLDFGIWVSNRVLSELQTIFPFLNLAENTQLMSQYQYDELNDNIKIKKALIKAKNVVEHHEEMTLKTQKNYIQYLLEVLNKHIQYDRNCAVYEIIKIT